ncbi:MAG: DnaJ domain-containing protein [Bacteroidetes bacterium]|nr:DnaJ domain-containing protein [Bacteroidota bacterium]
MLNLYAILQVEENATEREIKAAFRQLAKKYHPDVSDEENASQKFKDIYAAYDILMDPGRKEQYDLMRSYRNSGYGEAARQAAAQEKAREANMRDWEFKARYRADKYADMRWGDFKKQQLRGMDLVNHQLALTIAIGFFSLLATGVLYFAQTIVKAYLNNKTEWTSLFGAVVLVIFGALLFRQVIIMGRAFGDAFARKS